MVMSLRSSYNWAPSCVTLLFRIIMLFYLYWPTQYCFTVLKRNAFQFSFCRWCCILWWMCSETFLVCLDCLLRVFLVGLSGKNLALMNSLNTFGACLWSFFFFITAAQFPLPSTPWRRLPWKIWSNLFILEWPRHEPHYYLKALVSSTLTLPARRGHSLQNLKHILNSVNKLSPFLIVGFHGLWVSRAFTAIVTELL